MNVDLSVAPQKHSDDVIGPGPLISSTVYTHCEEVKIFLFLNCVWFVSFIFMFYEKVFIRIWHLICEVDSLI